MRVWVTRTEPGASRLGAALVDAGYEAWVRPVLKIESIAAVPPKGQFALTVFLSGHAVEFAVRNGWNSTPALAIGKTTRRVLASYGIDARMPDQSSSEGIIAALAADPPQSVMIAAGEGGRGVLERWLADRGIPAVKWCVYRRVAVEGSLDRAEAIDAIVASSEAALRVIANMWFASSTQPEGRDARPIRTRGCVGERLSALHARFRQPGCRRRSRGRRRSTGSRANIRD